jgi:hypothetical protein
MAALVGVSGSQLAMISGIGRRRVVVHRPSVTARRI